MKEQVFAGLCCCLFSAGLMGCGEPITSVDDAVEVVLPVTDVTTAPAETEPIVTTTTEPIWRKNAAEIEDHGMMVENVPHFTQFTSYLTACETLAAVTLLQYYRIDMSPERFLDGYLPIADYPELGEDGELHAESPWDFFIGDPMQDNAFGCYNSAIVTGINKIKEGLAIAVNGETLDDLCSHYIDQGQPVVIWATMSMAPAYETFEWIIPSGDRYTFISPEHALVLIGYDDNHYYFSDSLQEPDQYAYRKQAVADAYEALFSQAVVIDPDVLAEVPDFWMMQQDAED